MLPATMAYAYGHIFRNSHGIESDIIVVQPGEGSGHALDPEILHGRWLMGCMAIHSAWLLTVVDISHNIITYFA